MTIDYSCFINFCAALTNKNLQTLWQKKGFRLVSVSHDRLDWVVASTGKARYSTKSWIMRYLDGYAQTGSLHPRDYKGTTESSYILALIDLYVRDQQSKGTKP